MIIPPPDEPRTWWPLFARRKAARSESLLGWLDDWRRYRQSAPTEAPLPAPVAAPVLPASAAPAAPIRVAQAPATIEVPSAPPPGRGSIELPAAPPAMAGAALPAAGPAPVPATPPPPIRGPEPQPAPRRDGLIARLRRGLSRSSDQLTAGISNIFSLRRIDEDTLEELEDLLIGADLGVVTARRLTESLRASKVDKGASPGEVKELLAREVERVLAPAEAPLEVGGAAKPHVVLVVGVNGTGKTTTIGKLAQKLKGEGRSVLIVAGDTFRAAAIEQLKIWGERTGSQVMARETGADSAGLAFDALEKARAEGIDVVLIDTAGRLQNKTALMAELDKITRVLKKLDPAAPHSVIQVLDATTGQNAIGQVEAFQKTAGVTGLIMTKLDGTAKGGILVPLTEKFGLPIHAIGVGEAVEDLQPFSAAAFARALAGTEEVAR